MTGFLGQWGSDFWATLRETAPFLVLGLFLAGMLHVLVPPRIVLWALGHGGWRGAIRGALIGLPLPLCSCGVVPTALALRRQGASLSATASFTVSTPETSIDAIAITAALLPAVFLGVRPLAALILAVLVGIAVEAFSATTREQLRTNVLKLSRLMDRPGGGQAPPASGAVTAAEICRVCGLMTLEEHRHRLGSRLGAVFRYAFGTFFRDIATWLMLGLVVAALIQVLIPAGGLSSTWLSAYPSLEVLFAIIVGIPLYSCATATTPLAAVLLTKGLNPGAALALLLAGPATNIGTYLVLRRELGGRVTLIYYSTLIGICCLFGIGFNALWPVLRRYPTLMSVAGESGSIGMLARGIPASIELVCSWLLIVLTLGAWLRFAVSRFRPRDHARDEHAGHAH